MADKLFQQVIFQTIISLIRRKLKKFESGIIALTFFFLEKYIIQTKPIYLLISSNKVLFLSLLGFPFSRWMI